MAMKSILVLFCLSSLIISTVALVIPRSNPTRINRVAAVTEQQSNRISSFYAGPGISALPLLVTQSPNNSTPSHTGNWNPSSWKKYPIKQPPNYPDEAKAEEVVSKLSKCSPLVFAGLSIRPSLRFSFILSDRSPLRHPSVIS